MFFEDLKGGSQTFVSTLAQELELNTEVTYSFLQAPPENSSRDVKHHRKHVRKYFGKLSYSNVLPRSGIKIGNIVLDSAALIRKKNERYRRKNEERYRRLVMNEFTSSNERLEEFLGRALPVGYTDWQ